MARNTQTILESLIAKLPNGWGLGSRGGVLDAIYHTIGGVIAEAEQGAEDLMSETDPRRADKLLADFERCLGKDPCGRSFDLLTVHQRRNLAYQRWTARGGQSIPYYVSVAAALGVAVTITEFWPSRAGALRSGQRLRPEGCQFVWRVNIPGLTKVMNFKSGTSRARHRLGSFEISSVECVLRRYAPAHTQVVFSYGVK